MMELKQPASGGDQASTCASVLEDFSFDVINVVALGVLRLQEGQQVDLKAVAGETGGRFVRRFPGIVFKVRHVSVVLFRNGKMVLTGFKNISEIPVVRSELEALFKQVGIHYDEFTVEVQNLVVMTNLNRRVNLESGCLALENCMYEPEQFPACVVRPPGRGTFLVFANSKIIGLGFKTKKQAGESLQSLVTDLLDGDLIF